MRNTIEPQRFDALARIAGDCSGDDLRELRRRAGLSVAELAEWTGKHRTTIRRMERGERHVGAAVARLAAILAGVMPYRGWSGWHVTDRLLCNPHDARHSYHAGEIHMVRYAWDQAAHARGVLRRAGVAEAIVARELPAYRDRAA